MPPRVLAKVWEYFDSAGPLVGRPWPITYRWSDEERVAHLGAMGVRRFSALSYAHKPGMATFLNDWARDFAAEYPQSLRSATFYPEPEAGTYVRAAIEDGVEVFKTHIQVGGFDPADPLLDDAWGAFADSGTPVVVHAGSGPRPGAYTGPDRFARVLAEHPNLPAIIAHMGAPEYEEFLALAETYEHVRLDTTMAFTDFFDDADPYPRELLPRLLDLQPKILLGSDFPNIPYAYAHQIEALERLGLGASWLRDVCWHNGASLFGAVGS